jgi:hypothetical protein
MDTIAEVPASPFKRTTRVCGWAPFSGVPTIGSASGVNATMKVLWGGSWGLVMEVVSSGIGWSSCCHNGSGSQPSTKASASGRVR